MCGLGMKNHELELLGQIRAGAECCRCCATSAHNCILLHAPRQPHKIPEVSRPSLVVVNNYCRFVRIQGVTRLLVQLAYSIFIIEVAMIAKRNANFCQETSFVPELAHGGGGTLSARSHTARKMWG